MGKKARTHKHPHCREQYSRFSEKDLVRLQFLYEYSYVNKVNFCRFNPISRQGLDELIKKYKWERKPEQLSQLSLEQLTGFKNMCTTAELRNHGFISSQQIKFDRKFQRVAQKLNISTPPEPSPVAHTNQVNTINNIPNLPSTEYTTESIGPLMRQILEKTLRSLQEKLEADTTIEVITTDLVRFDPKTQTYVNTGATKTLKKAKRLDAPEIAKILQSMYPFFVSLGVIPKESMPSTNIQLNNNTSPEQREHGTNIKTLFVNNSLDTRFQEIMQKVLMKNQVQEIIPNSTTDDNEDVAKAV